MTSKQAAMKILAIDPGPKQSAYVLWDGASALKFGIVRNGEVFEQFMERPDYMAIEMIACYGMPVGAETFETCVWIGRFQQAWTWDYEESRCHRIPRLDIKVHLCKTAKAKDANIRQALIDRFGQPGTKKAQGPLYGITSHCWAALALAVCAHDRLSIGVQ